MHRWPDELPFISPRLMTPAELSQLVNILAAYINPDEESKKLKELDKELLPCLPSATERLGAVAVVKAVVQATRHRQDGAAGKAFTDAITAAVRKHRY